MASRGQPETSDRAVQQVALRCAKRTVPLRLRGAERRIRGGLPPALRSAGGGDARRDSRGGLGRRRHRGVDIVHPGRGLHQQIQPVEEGAGYPCPIAHAPGRRARAAAGAVAEVAAGAGVHCADELKAGGKIGASGSAGDRDPAGFQGLAQDIEHSLTELAELVEEEHASMGEGNLSGPRVGAAAHQRDGGGAVVRRAEGAPRPVPRVEGQRRHRHDGGGFEGFFLAHGRQQPRQSLREHRLPGARRTDHEEMMPTARRDLERPPGTVLSANLRHVSRWGLRAPPPVRHVCGERRFPDQVPVNVEQVPRREDSRVLDQSRRALVAGGQHERPAGVTGLQGARQRAAALRAACR